jgi:hypothetical protein
MKESRFSVWYETQFGNVLGAEDAENRDGMRQIWNQVVENMALYFEINEYDDLSPEQIVDKLRRMKETK